MAGLPTGTSEWVHCQLTRRCDIGDLPGRGLPGCLPQRMPREQPARRHHRPLPAPQRRPPMTATRHQLAPAHPSTIDCSPSLSAKPGTSCCRCCSQPLYGSSDAMAGVFAVPAAESPAQPVSFHACWLGGLDGWCISLLPQPWKDIQYSSKDTRGYTPGDGGLGLYLVSDPPESGSAWDSGRGMLVENRCAHSYIYKYPIVLVEIMFKGKKQRIKAAVSSCCMQPLIMWDSLLGCDHDVHCVCCA